MTTSEEIIQQQQELIAQYSSTLGAYKDAQETLYNYISELHKLLITNDPKAMQIAIDQIGKLAERANQ